MSAGPKSDARKVPVFVPHPDDEADVRAGLDEVARGELLSAEESTVYLHWLETGEAPDDLRSFFETGERACPESRG
jgi:hypothetical protein